MKRNHLAVIVAGLMSAATIGAGAASADDYTTLLIDPNFVFDTVQYSGGAPTPAPGGQPGAARVFTHNDGRFITDTVWVLPDAAAATAAAAAFEAERARLVATSTNAANTAPTVRFGATNSLILIRFPSRNLSNQTSLGRPKHPEPCTGCIRHARGL